VVSIGERGVMAGRRTYVAWVGLVSCGLAVVGGCHAPSSAPPAIPEQVRLCGQGYKFPSTVVSVQPGPQWLLSRPAGCPEPTPLTVVPKSLPAPVRSASQSNVVTSPLQASTTVPSDRISGRPGDTPPTRIYKPESTGPSGSLGSPAHAVCRRAPEVRHRTLLFDIGSADLPELTQRDLMALRIDDVMYLRVEGYTDPSGSREVNEELGTARAQMVAAQLKVRLPAQAKLEVIGRGGCCFRSNDADSRRVEVTMLQRGSCGEPRSGESEFGVSPVTPVAPNGARLGEP